MIMGLILLKSMCVASDLFNISSSILQQASLNVGRSFVFSLQQDLIKEYLKSIKILYFKYKELLGKTYSVSLQ